MLILLVQKSSEYNNWNGLNSPQPSSNTVVLGLGLGAMIGVFPAVFTVEKILITATISKKLFVRICGVYVEI